MLPDFRLFLRSIAMFIVAWSYGKKGSELMVVHKTVYQELIDIRFGLQLDGQDPKKYIDMVEKFDT